MTILLTRRELLRLSSLPFLSGIAPHTIRADDELIRSSSTSLPLTPLNRFPRMMQEYYVRRGRAMEAENIRHKFALRSRADAENYVREVKQKIRACFGPLPPRTPLRPRITGRLERDTYQIEKIIFESRPGLPVTGNLYLPKGKKFPLPAVVAPCGHLPNAKAGENYQSFAQGLARLGYIVLIYDPIGQGERLQYPNEKLQSRIGNGVLEHLYAGNQQLLVNEYFSLWRAWDGIRALDYLMTRPEVDTAHLGLTGNSGGGTITTWLCGLDDRWTMAAPDCFVTTARRNLENELPQDIEQYPPRMLALGLDQDDFIAALAPRPVMLIAQEKDFFDVRGTEEAYQRLKHLYRLLGAEEKIGMFTGPTYHGYTKENREAMYRWFNRATGISEATTEPALQLEKDEDLWCTPGGQLPAANTRTVFSFTSEKSKNLARQRSPLSGPQLVSELTRLLKLPADNSVPDARILNRLADRRYPKKEFTAYAIESEPEAQAIVYRLSDEPHYSRPLRSGKRAVLYIAHLSSDAELREEPLIQELLKAESGAVFFTCDVRGIGESLPNTCGENHFFLPYGNDYFYAGHALMWDWPYVGQKTYDVLRVLAWLKAYGHTDIHLAAKGRGTIPATFAALLADSVVQVTLKNSLTAFADIAESEFYELPLSSLVPGILEKFDLPDCYRALAGKNLRQIEPGTRIAEKISG